MPMRLCDKIQLKMYTLRTMSLAPKWSGLNQTEIKSKRERDLEIKRGNTVKTEVCHLWQGSEGHYKRDVITT